MMGKQFPICGNICRVRYNIHMNTLSNMMIREFLYPNIQMLRTKL